MKRFQTMTIAAGFAFMTGLSGCTATSVNAAQDFDEVLAKTASASARKVPYYSAEGYNVTKLGANQFDVSINGVQNTILLPPESEPMTLGKNPTEITSGKIYDKYVKSREKVVKYINGSKIIQDKDNVIQKIQAMPVYQVNIIDPTDPAIAYYESGAINVVFEHQSYTCEWMFVHELIHALCDITNSVDGNYTDYRFKRTEFTEAITDVITASLKPQISNGKSAYDVYYPAAYKYIDVVGEAEAINAYFYGYENLVKDIGSWAEFEFFVVSFGNAEFNEFAKTCMYTSLRKWEEKKWQEMEYYDEFDAVG